MSWLVWGALLLPVMLSVGLTVRRFWHVAFPVSPDKAPSVAAQDRLLAEIGDRLAAVTRAPGSGRRRSEIPRLGPDQRQHCRWVPPPQVAMSLRIHTTQGPVRAHIADLSSQGFAAHVKGARGWKPGELLTCTLELIGQPYAEVRLRTRYVVFGGDVDPTWRIGLQVTAEQDTSRSGVAIQRLVDACEAARLAA